MRYFKNSNYNNTKPYRIIPKDVIRGKTIGIVSTIMAIGIITQPRITYINISITITIKGLKSRELTSDARVKGIRVTEKKIPQHHSPHHDDHNHSSGFNGVHKRYANGLQS